MVSENWNAFWTFGASKSVFEHRNTSRSIKNALAYQSIETPPRVSERVSGHQNASQSIKMRMKNRNAFCSIGTHLDHEMRFGPLKKPCRSPLSIESRCGTRSSVSNCAFEHRNAHLEALERISEYQTQN